VDRELVAVDLLLLERLLDQLLGDPAGLAVLDRPADRVAAVLFPDSLCGRRRWRPMMTGVNGQVEAFSGT
jgi:hypothetical protein